MRRYAGTALALVVAVACGGSPSAPDPPASGHVLVAESTRFELYFDGSNWAEARFVLDALDANYNRIVGDLQPLQMPRVRAYVWASDSDGWRDTMVRSAGAFYPGVQGFVSGPTELHILLSSQAPFHAVHEFVHCVSLAVNPRAANNPRWLWETVAVYENQQIVDPASLSYMRPGLFPTLSELNATVDQSGRIYQVGYVLGQFIVERWGLDALLRLIRTNADLAGVLGLSQTEFETGWYDWIVRTYLS